jgi:fido (protein-threonine AMPylation protein)
MSSDFDFLAAEWKSFYKSAAEAEQSVNTAPRLCVFSCRYNLEQVTAWIHPFPNGNGRHARLMADIFIENVLHGSPFTWGKHDLSNPGENRSRYINALHEADNGNYIPLLEFAKS